MSLRTLKSRLMQRKLGPCNFMNKTTMQKLDAAISLGFSKPSSNSSYRLIRGDYPYTMGYLFLEMLLRLQ